MVEQGGELHLLVFPCCFPHARQPLGHALPALSRVRVWLTSVLLDRRSSLLILRQRSFVFVRVMRGCGVGGGALTRAPPSAAQTARTLFAYAAFTKTQSCRDANEGINPIKLTSPCSRYSVFLGSRFQPPFLQRLYRCDQIRRTIQPSSRWKSLRTWARL